MIVTVILVGVTSMVEFAREAQIKLEARNKVAELLLEGNQSIHVGHLQPGATLADKNVVDVDLEVSLQGQRQLAPRQIAQTVQQDGTVQPVLQAVTKQYFLDSIERALVLVRTIDTN